jgi:hypothetical protein
MGELTTGEAVEELYIMTPKPGDSEIEPYFHGYSGEFYWLCFSLVDSVSAAVGKCCG